MIYRKARKAFLKEKACLKIIYIRGYDGFLIYQFYVYFQEFLDSNTLYFLNDHHHIALASFFLRGNGKKCSLAISIHHLTNSFEERKEEKIKKPQERKGIHPVMLG
jgi:hypothetical protein